MSGKSVIWKKTVTHFDAEGYILDSTGFDISGESKVRVRYVYDEAHNRKTIETSEPKKDPVIVEVEIDYQAKTVALLMRRKGKPPLKRQEYVVDGFRLMGEMREFDATGKSGNVTLFERDEHGRIKEQVVLLAPKSRELRRSTPTWDERGMEVASVVRSQEPEFTKTVTRSGIVLDAAGNWIQLHQEGTARFKDGGRSVDTPDDLVRVITYDD